MHGAGLEWYVAWAWCGSVRRSGTVTSGAVRRTEADSFVVRDWFGLVRQVSRCGSAWFGLSLRSARIRCALSQGPGMGRLVSCEGLAGVVSRRVEARLVSRPEWSGNVAGLEWVWIGVSPVLARYGLALLVAEVSAGLACVVARRRAGSGWGVARVRIGLHCRLAWAEEFRPQGGFGLASRRAVEGVGQVRPVSWQGWVCLVA